MTRISVMILALLVVMLSCEFTLAYTVTVEALPNEKIIAIDETAAFNIYGCYNDDTSQLQEGENTNCQWKYVGATAYSDEECTTEDSTIVSVVTTADTEWVPKKCYKKDITIKGIKAGVVWVKFRMKYRLNTENEGTEVLSNAVKIIVYDIGFIDKFPNYSLELEYDSDNFFLRQHDEEGYADYKNLYIYYYILPDVLPVSNVKITIREEEKEEYNTYIEQIEGVKKTDGNYKTGSELNVQWADVRDTANNFRDNRFYSVQLEVDINGVEETFKTPLGDADTTIPGYQCKEKCLVIHDLVYKHRPVVNMGSGEIVAPNGPVYPFSDNIINNYQLLKYYAEIDDLADEEILLGYDIDVAWTEPLPNYSGFGTFPKAAPMPLRQAFTYNYPVLRDSIENDSYYSIDHFIDIVNNNRNCASNEATLFHRGHISNGHKNGDYCFIQFWMYETASYAPYGIPIFGNSFWHEGDWEMVQICVKLTGTKKSDWFRPHAATASQHYYGQTLAWRINQSGPETQTQEYVGTEDNGNRVKIYIAENSHATYFRKGEINAAIYGNKSKCETQVQYEPIATILPDSFDKISAPLLSSRVYHLIPLNYKADKGIGDWPGIWGDSGGILPGTGGTSSPFFRKANTLTDTLNLDSESVLFHNNCRKIISGTLQPETEL